MATRVLAFDCSLASCAVAAVGFDAFGRPTVGGSATEPMRRGHAAALAPMIGSVLATAGWRAADLDLVATVVGPGSFTGLRIGLAMARGLGMALAVPVAGVGATRAMFLSLAPPDLDGIDVVVVAIDAGRGRRYAGLFDPGGGETGPDLFADGDLAAAIAGRRPLVVGDAAEPVLAMLAARGVAARGRSSAIVAPDPLSVAVAAMETGVDGWRDRNAREGMPRPLYLRGADVTLRDGSRATADLDDRRRPMRPPPFVPAGVSMAGILARLHRDAFSGRHERAWSAAEFAGLLSSPGCFAVAARDDDMDVGFALARVVLDEAELLTIGVASTHRRRGVAGGLLAHAMAACATRGAATLFLEVAVDNEAALGLYRANGFRVVGRRAGYFPGRSVAIDGLTMRADLASDGGAARDA